MNPLHPVVDSLRRVLAEKRFDAHRRHLNAFGVPDTTGDGSGELPQIIAALPRTLTPRAAVSVTARRSVALLSAIATLTTVQLAGAQVRDRPFRAPNTTTLTLPAEDDDPPVPAAEPVDVGPRLRLATHLMGGPWIVNDRGAAAGGLGVQLGVQLGDSVAVYYAGTAAGGIIGTTGGGLIYNAVVADLSFGGVYEVAVGPSVDVFAFRTIDLTAGTPLAGTFLGLNARVGVMYGALDPGRRVRLMIGCEVHPSFVRRFVPTTTLLTLGIGWF